jgi:hypothetical protein
LAVIATIGTLPAGGGIFRIAFVALIPSMRGIWMSISTRSYCLVSIARTASSPSAATSTSWPARPIIARASSWFIGRSSATRMQARRAGSGGALSSNIEGRPVRGRVTLNQKEEPWPGWLRKPISPPISSTSRFDIDRPSPVPHSGA